MSSVGLPPAPGALQSPQPTRFAEWPSRAADGRVSLSSMRDPSLGRQVLGGPSSTQGAVHLTPQERDGGEGQHGIEGLALEPAQAGCETEFPAHCPAGVNTSPALFDPRSPL